MWWIQSSLNSAKKKYLESGKIDGDLFNELSYLDPTQNKKYLEWLCSHSDLDSSSLYSLFLLCLMAQDIVPGFNFQDQYQGRGKLSALEKKLSEFSSYWIKRACNLNSLNEGKDYEILSVKEDNYIFSNKEVNLPPKAIQVFSLISEKMLAFKFPFYRVLFHVKTQKGMTAIGSGTPWCIVPASNTYWDSHYHLDSGNKLFVSAHVIFGGTLFGEGRGRRALVVEPASRKKFKVFQAVTEENKAINFAVFSAHSGLTESELNGFVLGSFSDLKFEDLSSEGKFLDMVSGTQIKVVPGQNFGDPIYKINVSQLDLEYSKDLLNKDIAENLNAEECFAHPFGKPVLAGMFLSKIVPFIEERNLRSISVYSEFPIYSLGSSYPSGTFLPVTFSELNITTDGFFHGFHDELLKKNKYLDNVLIKANNGYVSLDGLNCNVSQLSVYCKEIYLETNSPDTKIHTANIYLDSGSNNKIYEGYSDFPTIKYLNIRIDGKLDSDIPLLPGPEQVNIYTGVQTRKLLRLVSKKDLPQMSVFIENKTGLDIECDIKRLGKFGCVSNGIIRHIVIPDTCDRIDLSDIKANDFSFLRGKVVLVRGTCEILGDSSRVRSFKGLEEFSCPDLVLTIKGGGEWDFSYLPTHIEKLTILAEVRSDFLINIKRAIREHPDRKELEKIIHMETY